MIASVDLERLGLHRGGHLLLKRALKQLQPGELLQVQGIAPDLPIHLRAWCRAQGHGLVLHPEDGRSIAIIQRGDADLGRWHRAERAGASDARSAGAVVDEPLAHWGLAARGAYVEAGSPEFTFSLNDKCEVWADEAARLYAQAAAAQWDPATAIDWSVAFDLPEEIEDAVVQVMTFLIENETAALLVPARFLAQLHPHFREVMQFLAIQTADEARHIEVFTRRASLHRPQLGLSTAGGQQSLKTLIDEPDFALASFLLSVLGEGSFLHLLWFLRDYGPDPLTRQVADLAAKDEARHVAFGMAHLTRHSQHDPSLRARLAQAIHSRHQALQHTAGLNEEVFDALMLIAAGSWLPQDLATGHKRVVQLTQAMEQGRRKRLIRLGFVEAEAVELSGLHTRNFM